MLDILKGVANLLGGPMTAVVDLAGNALGLPPVLTQSIKTAAGVMTGNVMMAASGALGVADELKKNPPAKTEYCAPQDAAKAGAGYAPAANGGSSQAGAGAAGSRSPLDPKLLDYADSLRTLEANFGYLDLMDGRKDGTLSHGDLQRIAQDANVSPSLRDAAKFLVDNRGFFEQVDTAQKKLLHVPVPNFNDDRIDLMSLQQESKRLAADFAKYGRPERPGRPSPTPSDCDPVPSDCPPPATGGGSGPGPGSGAGRPGGGTGGAGRPGGGTGGSSDHGSQGPGGTGRPGSGSSNPGSLDPNLAGYRDALRVLDQNWDTFDTAVGAKDGKLSMANMEALLGSPAASPTLKRAAQFFKDNPEYFNRLEMAAGSGLKDGVASRQDLNAELAVVAKLPEVPGTSPNRPNTGGTRARDIVDNPNMSIEQKVQALLMGITEDTDAELLDVMNEMASAREERATLGTSDSDKARGAKLDTSMQELELRLQTLMEKRKAMFDLMSNMSSKFNEMAKTAISNLRSA